MNRSVVLVLISFLFVTHDAFAGGATKLLSRQEALEIAQMEPEVKGLYALNNGEFAECIEKEVLKPCESDWVTCVDDAWVVRFKVGEKCFVTHDGRLDVILLIDAISGKVISRFPESEYFLDRNYCKEDYDCLSLQKEGKRACLNFIYGQLLEGYQDEGCWCENNVCQIKD
ncbi:hypothetical protein MNBD_UNCLBAC01-1288 [hydrothermal vent metagenome]|uniref:Uncharacterized protein n=1 Tax=hydrothermal vent metagenome TaxID=652676 RepID=A0A3B1DP81_9ZZZZ